MCAHARHSINVKLEDLDPDPIVQLQRWLDDAIAAGLPHPTAMALATADAGGQPSVRHVLLKGLDERGLEPHTNYESRKGRDLAGDSPARDGFAGVRVGGRAGAGR